MEKELRISVDHTNINFTGEVPRLSAIEAIAVYGALNMLMDQVEEQLEVYYPQSFPELSN